MKLTYKNEIYNLYFTIDDLDKIKTGTIYTLKTHTGKLVKIHLER